MLIPENRASAIGNTWSQHTVEVFTNGIKAAKGTKGLIHHSDREFNTVAMITYH